MDIDATDKKTDRRALGYGSAVKGLAAKSGV